MDGSVPPSVLLVHGMYLGYNAYSINKAQLSCYCSYIDAYGGYIRGRQVDPQDCG